MIALRPYQSEMCAAAESSWETHQRALIVAATGTGKTTVFTELVGRAVRNGKRAMILADRIELVEQAAERCREQIGIAPDIEMGEHRAASNWLSRSPVVISTVQTQRSGRGSKRREQFDPGEFSLLVMDEAHQSITPTTEATLAHYAQNKSLRILGVTATPDRGDKRALGRIYEHVAYRYDIIDAIDDGWLVPVHGKTIMVESLDLSVLPETKRDYTDEQIARLMEEQGPLVEVTSTLLKAVPNKRTLVFAARVAHAEAMSEILNRERPGAARVISGTTPEAIRRQTIHDFAAGKFPYLLNCAVLTTGFDSPGVECVAIARPTKSRALFAQMCGRGTRPLPGVVDGIEDASARRDAIEASAKQSVLILSFVGKAGGLDLVGPEDVLGGNYSDPVVRRAKQYADDGSDESIEDRLERAEAEIEKENRIKLVQVSGDARYQARDVDLFRRGEHIEGTQRGAAAISEGTLKVLSAARVPDKHIRAFTPREAGRIAREIIRRRHAGLCTYRQGMMLRSKCGMSREQIRTMTFQQASAELSKVLPQRMEMV